MKKVLTIVLIFALVMAALVGAAELWERHRPVKPAAPEGPGASGEPSEEAEITVDPDASATTVVFSEDGLSVSGIGVDVAAGSMTATIGYPGTYRVSGVCSDGQLVVDLGDFSGSVYIILDGLTLACSDGPALHARQADLTAVYTAAGSVNLLRDGGDYLVQEGQEKKTGAGIYSADDLYISGEGALTVVGSASDGIRSKDALTIAGGELYVYAADDGLQASDWISVTGGDITVTASGDGVTTTDGYVEITGGSLSVTADGDGVDAVTDLRITGGSISAMTGGGPENYAAVAVEERSAKGLKAANVTVSGGGFYLWTADDGIHADRDVTITGGSFGIAAGDDAVSAGSVLNVHSASFDVFESYEAMQGDRVLLSGVSLNATAENNGIDAGEGGAEIYNASMHLSAPRGISSDGVLNMMGVDIVLTADGTDSLFAYPEGSFIGCSILASTDTGRSDVLLSKGKVEGAVLFGFAQAVPAGTEFVIAAPSGEAVYVFSFDRDVTEVLVGMGGLLEGQTYTMTAGDEVMIFVYTAQGCVISEQALPVTASSGGWGPGGGMPGMPGGGPR